MCAIWSELPISNILTGCVDQAFPQHHPISACKAGKEIYTISIGQRYSLMKYIWYIFQVCLVSTVLSDSCRKCCYLLVHYSISIIHYKTVLMFLSRLNKLKEVVFTFFFLVGLKDMNIKMTSLWLLFQFPYIGYTMIKSNGLCT